MKIALKRGLTRGDGITEDVTHNVKTRNIPLRLKKRD